MNSFRDREVYNKNFKMRCYRIILIDIIRENKIMNKSLKGVKRKNALKIRKRTNIKRKGG